MSDPVTIIFFIILFILIYLIIDFKNFASENDLIKARLERVINNSDNRLIDINNNESGVEKKDKKKLQEILRNIGEIIAPKGITNKISHKLEVANIPLRANEFIAINLLTTTIPLSFCWFTIKNFYIGLIVGFIGFIFPHIWLNMVIKRRRKLFEDQLLDALVMLANSMRAGYSFLQGIELISRESPPPMSEEFSCVVRENSLGMDIEKSLLDMNKRMQSEDFDLVVTVVLIQRQIGGNLSEILDRIADTIRERIRIKGEIRTLTAQARLSGIIVALLPLGIFIMFSLIRPDLTKMLFTFKEGWFRGYYVILLAVFMQLIGFVIIRSITNIEV